MQYCLDHVGENILPTEIGRIFHNTEFIKSIELAIQTAGWSYTSHKDAICITPVPKVV